MNTAPITPATLATLIAIMIVCCCSCESMQRNAVTLSMCPAGHKTIEVVPDSFSTTFFEEDDGKLAQFQTPGFLLCKQCGYKQDPKHLFWERDSDRVDAFGLPLTSLIAGLSIPEVKLLTREMDFYSQYIKEGEVRWEYAVYRTSEPYEIVLGRVETYIKSAGVEIEQRDTKLFDTKQGVEFRGSWRGFEFRGKVIYVEVYQDTYVSLDLHKGNIWNLDDDGPLDLDMTIN